ncbi:hypothetical protein ABI_24830 [Asticcacaulis biprosthecium C19]|uniref:Uncharacterized protein n=1 Tax=Asticcacaulis biprosthecium C19 TaxID=715226 RepID=F4QP11_9CAUL|nr:hypothetical protein ABI_24830 [Asticcacaulis biprosthecium C19]
MRVAQGNHIDQTRRVKTFDDIGASAPDAAAGNVYFFTKRFCA